MSLRSASQTLATQIEDAVYALAGTLIPTLESNTNSLLS